MTTVTLENEFWYCGPQAYLFPRGHGYCFCDFLFMEILVRLVLYILEKKADRTSHHVIKKLKLLESSVSMKSCFKQFVHYYGKQLSYPI